MTGVSATSGMLAYTILASKRDWSIGAYPTYTFSDGSSFRDAHVQEFYRNAFGEVERLGPQCVSVSSPWHAALFLQSVMNACSLDGERLIFRGQANSEWPIVASLFRQGVDAEAERKRANVFCRLLAAISWNTSLSMHPYSRTNIYLRVSPRAYLATAQHYGIKTNLVDFTFDPDIAVKFATINAPPGARYSSVFVVNVTGNAIGPIAVLLPPPMTERIYAQRGLFIPVDSAADLARLNVLEVRFPCADHNVEFEVQREHGSLGLYPSEENLRPAMALADRLVVETEVSNDKFDLLAQSLKSSMSQTLLDPDTQWARFTDVFEDILYSLVYDLSTPGAMRLNEHAMRQLVRDNVETCCSVGGIYRTLDRRYPGAYPKEQGTFLRHIAAVIDHFAQEQGYDHRKAGREYATSVLRLESVEVH